MITLFSGRYWGWGNATKQLIEAIEALDCVVAPCYLLRRVDGTSHAPRRTAPDPLRLICLTTLSGHMSSSPVSKVSGTYRLGPTTARPCVRTRSCGQRTGLRWEGREGPSPGFLGLWPVRHCCEATRDYPRIHSREQIRQEEEDGG
jgi:hypothetical protein